MRLQLCFDSSGRLNFKIPVYTPFVFNYLCSAIYFSTRLQHIKPADLKHKFI
jgi:hypothetical protein